MDNGPNKELTNPNTSKAGFVRVASATLTIIRIDPRLNETTRGSVIVSFGFVSHIRKEVSQNTKAASKARLRRINAVELGEKLSRSTVIG